MSPSITETVKFFLRVSAKSAHGDFFPLKNQRYQSFITILLSVSKCYRDSLCKVCSWRLSSSEKSEISKFHYNFVECFSECLCKVYSLDTAKRYEISMFQYNSLSMLSLSDPEITILKVCSRVPTHAKFTVNITKLPSIPVTRNETVQGSTRKLHKHVTLINQA